VFVDVTQRRNPGLIEAAVELNRSGQVPSNCYVIDIDTVAENARLVSRAAQAEGLGLFQMTKQFGRNPLVARAVADNGIRKVVAVDVEEARILHAWGLEMGHLGHLVQLPRHSMSVAMEMQPELVTVFNLEQARAVSQAASDVGRVQPILVRVVGPSDTFYPAQRGGVRVDDLAEAVKAIADLPGVQVAGLTSFPCLLWDEHARELRPTPNLSTVRDALGVLVDAGVAQPVFNAPSATCIASLATLREHGATLVEPGSCLTGHTPLHAVTDQPERPAMVYVTEIAHTDADVAYALGGGYYPRSRAAHALVFGQGGGDPSKLAVEPDPPDAIDYYGTLRPLDGPLPAVGDVAVYAFRSQVFVSRSFVAVVRDVDSTPEVLGVFDRSGFLLGADLLPVAAPDRVIS
jgi:predicted amino acid racemase